MIENAVKAFVNAIDDPYTVYMDAQQNSGFHQDLKGEQDFEGIGAVTTPPSVGVLAGGGNTTFSPNVSVNAGFSRRDMAFIVKEGSQHNQITEL